MESEKKDSVVSNSSTNDELQKSLDEQINHEIRITIDAAEEEPKDCLGNQFNDSKYSGLSSLIGDHETSLCSTSHVDGADDENDYISGDTSNTDFEEASSVHNLKKFCTDTEEAGHENNFSSRHGSSKTGSQNQHYEKKSKSSCKYYSPIEEEEKENIPLAAVEQNRLDPFSLLNEYNKIEPKDRPTPIDLEAGVFWFVLPNPDDCGVIWRILPVELTEGPYNKDSDSRKLQEEPKVKKLVDLYRAFSIHIRVKHPVMGEGMCLALVFIGETVLLKPETKNSADVDYWHRLMMSIKIKDFPEIYGRPVTRHDFMDVAWAVSIVGRPTIWDSPNPFHGSTDIYKAHRFFQGPKWFAIYDNTLYLCDQDVIPQRCNPPYRPDNSVEIPWNVVYQIGVERCYFYMRMTANGPWGLGTIYLMLESWDAAKAVSAHFRYLSSSKNPFQKIRVRDAEESEEVPEDESKSWFFSLSGWKSRQRRERLREEGKDMQLIPKNRRIDLFDRLIPKTQEDLEIEMEQMSAPPIKDQILQAIALWHTHPPPP
uniref:DUF3444 domain-containing protein n=1 Tax=Syphacia muris TaxID=451379 RepID=A0A0N5B1A1_9BILA